MLPNRRRHQYIIGTERRRSRFIGRAAIVLIALLIAWYLALRVFALFDHAVGKRAATLLSIRSGLEGAQVSLQGGEWQRPETSLKLYPGDSVALRGNSDLVLTFFDGTRVRLDRGSELMIGRSDSYGQKGSSLIELTVKTGRVWINTPSVITYSGSITRTVVLQPYRVEVPANTSGLLSPTEITVLRAAGIGLKATLSFGIAGNNEVYVGEGQHLNVGEDAKRAIRGGSDPYDFRDPILTQALKDEFLLSSYSLFSSSAVPGQTSAGAESPLPGDDQNLVLTSPENAASITSRTVPVNGRVSSRVALLLVNGQSVPIRKDLSFSVDMSLSKDPTTRIRVEAQDAQGLILGQAELSVTNAYKPIVSPVRIKSPVGSGETLTTSLREIEITGEALQGTAGIIVNDYRLQLFKPADKTWSYLASTALGNLLPGPNLFTVYAVDADGNRSEPRSITIVLKENGAGTASGEVVQPPLKQNPPLTPGVLTVESPLAGASITTAEKEVVIEGRTSAETSGISVNGYSLSLYQPGKTTWNYIASTDLRTMKRGKNVYRIVARNKDGEILDILEYSITFKP